MKNILIILIFIPAFLLNHAVLGQNMNKKMKKREVIANYSDSLVKANVLIDNKRIDTKDYVIYYWFKSGKINKNMGGYDGNLLNGRYVVFDDNNNMVTEGYFKKGVKHGTWKQWLPQGGLLSKQSWKNGELDGTCLLYNKQGNMLQISKYKKGKRHGEYILYNKGVETKRKFRHGVEILPKEKKSKEKSDSPELSDSDKNKNKTKKKEEKAIKPEKVKKEKKEKTIENKDGKTKKSELKKEEKETKDKSFKSKIKNLKSKIFKKKEKSEKKTSE